MKRRVNKFLVGILAMTSILFVGIMMSRKTSSADMEHRSQNLPILDVIYVQIIPKHLVTQVSTKYS